MSARERFETELLSDDGFLLGLRSEYEWDQAAFSRIEQRWRELCAEYETCDALPRSLVDGVYELSVRVPTITAHEQFRRPPEPYYAACLKRVEDLTYWFFTGESPYVDDYVWEPL